MASANLGIGLAFLAGLASFLSPCVFSLVPAYVGYLTGRTAASSRSERQNTWNSLSHGLAFVLGFSVVFIVLGVATSMLGGLLYDISNWLAKIGGAVVVLFGLHMTGILRIPFLEYDLRPQSTPDRKRGYLASALMGVFFSAGWSPCVGPILGAILTLALSEGSILRGAQLLTAYSAGLAIPFLVASTQIGLVTTIIRRYGKLMHYVEVGMGAVLIVVGIMLFTGRFETLARYGSFFGFYDEVLLGKQLLLLLGAAILLGLIPAWIARSRGKNFLEWWAFGAFLFPVAMILVWRPKPVEFIGEMPKTVEDLDDGNDSDSPYIPSEIG